MRRSRVKVVAIVPAAGSGKRLGLKIKKPFVLLNGKPLVTYALAALEKSNVIDGIMVAAERSSVERFRRLIKRYKFRKIIDVVIGGKTRSESVRNCLSKIAPSFGIIAIHDGARPLVDQSLISGSVRLAKKFGACVAAVPENDTVKIVDSRRLVKKTLDRTMVWRAQTPQAFRRDIILKAYGLKDAFKATDDSSLVERLGQRVRVLEGSRRNIKITTKEDLKLAEALL